MDKKKFIQITSGEIASITHEMFLTTQMKLLENLILCMGNEALSSV